MENEHYTAYDLEREDPKKPGVSEIPQNSGKSNPTEESDHPDNPENPDPSAGSVDEADDEARKEIEAMISEMGSKKVLSIIKANRNSVISQLMDEMERQAPCDLSSGESVIQDYLSIFDMAAMA